MSYDQHHATESVLTAECLVLFNLFDGSTILSIAGGIFLLLSIVRAFMDIYYHPRRKNDDRQGSDSTTDQRNTGPPR